MIARLFPLPTVGAIIDRPPTDFIFALFTILLNLVGMAIGHPLALPLGELSAQLTERASFLRTP